MATVPFFVLENHRDSTSTQIDVSVVDNKTPVQSVAIHTAKELPLRLGVLIDTSNSEKGSNLSIHQFSSMENIDRSLSELTQMGPEYWTEDAVRESAYWKRLRTLAAAALESFGWAQETPPRHADEYVGGK